MVGVAQFPFDQTEVHPMGEKMRENANVIDNFIYDSLGHDFI